ncbi:SSI family serine proteinase inhibitor [Actinocrispum wychmicini]|uniref:SSI family serine proteinase inhibitor n=1 Tax=Actinocrispum wychmicini TaxID=1213861 RepID=UPI001FB70126|nr:SSI family serine proteinase inhibitor [Actinocrispum wychmicini]
MRTTAALVSAAAFLLVPVLANAVPANAAPADTSLLLTKDGPGVDPVTGLLPKLITLACEPTGGTHPTRDDACAVLAKAGGDFNRIEPLHRMCTLNYAPVRASAHGTWRGRPVDWTAMFPNDCAAGSQTDLVFDF